MSYKFLSGLAQKVAIGAISLTMVVTAFSTLTTKAQTTANRGLVISPAISELDADRGSSYEYQILVENDSTQSMDIKTFVQTFEASNNEGQPTIKDFAPDSTLPNWFRFNERNFTVKARENYKSKFNVNVPLDALPGSYYFAITYSTTDNSVNTTSSQVQVETRVQSLLFTNVKGRVERQVKFETFSTESQVYDPFFDGIKLDYKIGTSGNVYLRPSGNIFVGYDDGNPENKASLNPDQKIIMPNSARSFGYVSKAIWDGIWFGNKVSSDSKYQELDMKPKWFGNQKVKAVIIYANSDGALEKKETTVEVFFFPWKLLSLAIGAIIVIIAGIVGFRIYKNNKKVEKMEDKAGK